MCVAAGESTHRSSSVGCLRPCVACRNHCPSRRRPGASTVGVHFTPRRYSRLQQTFATTTAAVVEKLYFFGPRAPLKQAFTPTCVCNGRCKRSPSLVSFQSNSTLWYPTARSTVVEIPVHVTWDVGNPLVSEEFSLDIPGLEASREPAYM